MAHIEHPSIDELARDPLPLRGRVALVTGVSRRDGIGYAVARRLAAYGASVFCHHYRPHDEEQPWGADDIAEVLAGVRAALAAPGARVADTSADMADPAAPARVVAAAAAEFGHVDILVCNHARSGGDTVLDDITAEQLDGHWAVNTRSAILLAKEFAAQHDGRPGGRLLLMTSGQGQGPMPAEVAYASAKGALAAITLTLAEHLADRHITVNAVNPGPVQTGYLTEQAWRHLGRLLPFGRWGYPDDPARLIAWLATDEGRWITGQVINSEGGFARWRAGAGTGADPEPLR
ncbi:SDR family oxidoreductase [Marinitenerispora sediminis]|uniref:3-ketoacyl-ACP reductase n=1 Tax=Marinitenerispora sediminis TaxID=1931232 RepID=A0A368T741_9ACTN|nr:SDR family oxidoreductase [Marinitenerispora sediminis]RCV49597.1 3-ketoacyl-ACP reductase [Marinitenerispora sediminis]RCV53053.1 3-ketoacyl-ACP reductase [Marinitenerispora sediminis]RCV59810.1 3-ketoacyl-ACP reductase [Marinitenerispora sediminis]